jgi:hypothetical protein
MDVAMYSKLWAHLVSCQLLQSTPAVVQLLLQLLLCLLQLPYHELPQLLDLLLQLLLLVTVYCLHARKHDWCTPQ